MEPTPESLESFRFGFLNRCARNGLSAREAVDLADRHCEKLARLNKEGQFGTALATGAGFLGGKALDLGKFFGQKGFGYIEKLLPWLAGTALLAAPATGALAGYGLGSLHGIEGESEQERRQRELAEAYQEGARRLSGR